MGLQVESELAVAQLEVSLRLVAEMFCVVTGMFDDFVVAFYGVLLSMVHMLATQLSWQLKRFSIQYVVQVQPGPTVVHPGVHPEVVWLLLACVWTRHNA
jgi:hypothetical protein